MSSVTELTEPYENFLLGPRPGPGVCEVCFNLTEGYRRCYACTKNKPWLDAFVAISYSVGQEQLHHVLRSYKRLDNRIGRRFCFDIAAILWRFLEGHEKCLAAAAEVPRFDLVTTVPSGDRLRDHDHPLHSIVGSLVEPTKDRHVRTLAPSGPRTTDHTFSDERFTVTRELDNQAILLIDDTWTTGASAQSAAAALKRAGAAKVAAVVIGRYLNREYQENDRRLRELSAPFRWDTCALCVGSSQPERPAKPQAAPTPAPQPGSTD